MLNIKHKEVSDIKGMEKYQDYIVDIEGNVWTTKNRNLKKLSPGWAVSREGHLYVRLSSNDSKTIKNFYVHRLVALAFIPNDTDNEKMIVVHRDQNFKNNRVENLAWQKRVKHAKLINKRKKIEEENTIIDKFKIIRQAALQKGINVPTEEEFMNSIINTALDEYISRYGLRKLLSTKSPI